MFDSVLFQIAFIIFLGILSQWIAWRFRMPAIVIMSLAGLMIGPFFGLLNPTEAFGEVFNPFISLAVSVILFEGSLSLDFREIKGFHKSIIRVSTIGAFIAWIAGSIAAHYLAGLSWEVAFVIGGLFIVTGPTVILPLLRQAKLKERPAAILKWEGIVVDPFGALLGLFAFQIVLFIDRLINGSTLIAFFVSSAAAIVIGIIFGIVIGNLLERGYIPEFLKSPVVLGSVLFAFGLSDLIMHETGLLAVTTMGIVMANMHLSSLHDLVHFKENISVLLISSVFIMLTASLSVETLASLLDWRMLGFVLVMMFIVRPLSIWISTIGVGLTIQERTLLGWIAPRGIVALTVSGYFANVLQKAGFQSASIITALTLALVFSTVLAHGFSISWLAKKLDLQATEEAGVVIVGGSPFTAILGKALASFDKPVLIMDRSWRNLYEARQAGLKTEVGDILSEHTEYYVDLMPYEKLIAATDEDAYNALICANFVPALGRESIYQTTIHSGDPTHYRKSLGGKMLFEPNFDIHTLNNLVRKGYVIRKTSLTDVYTFDHYQKQNEGISIPLFSISGKNELHFFVNGRVKDVSAGTIVVSLSKPN